MKGTNMNKIFIMIFIVINLHGGKIGDFMSNQVNKGMDWTIKNSGMDPNSQNANDAKDTAWEVLKNKPVDYSRFERQGQKSSTNDDSYNSNNEQKVRTKKLSSRDYIKNAHKSYKKEKLKSIIASKIPYSEKCTLYFTKPLIYKKYFNESPGFFCYIRHYFVKIIIFLGIIFFISNVIKGYKEKK